ncbi:hypothetical protein HK097_006924 [Rhizophlyctis rosea]|uniref:Uncharacterized protein n=1 Tax=Rhizophlyctis rosea TaxID=64517 RepID=A0AAD5SJS4_9FUNG|nr:hypothetical protein HK097_006924 [Rhizophlyctis rosea]
MDVEDIPVPEWKKPHTGGGWLRVHVGEDKATESADVDTGLAEGDDADGSDEEDEDQDGHDDDTKGKRERRKFAIWCQEEDVNNAVQSLGEDMVAQLSPLKNGQLPLPICDSCCGQSVNGKSGNWCRNYFRLHLWMLDELGKIQRRPDPEPRDPKKKKRNRGFAWKGMMPGTFRWFNAEISDWVKAYNLEQRKERHDRKERKTRRRGRSL